MVLLGGRKEPLRQVLGPAHPKGLEDEGLLPAAESGEAALRGTLRPEAKEGATGRCQGSGRHSSWLPSAQGAPSSQPRASQILCPCLDSGSPASQCPHGICLFHAGCQAHEPSDA